MPVTKKEHTMEKETRKENRKENRKERTKEKNKEKIKEKKKETPSTVNNKLFTSPPRGKTVDDQFEELWKVYEPYAIPKGPKKKAKEKFLRLIKNKEPFEEIMLGTRRYIADCHNNQRYTKNVVTFLNQEYWKDFLLGSNFKNPDPMPDSIYIRFETKEQMETQLKPYFTTWFKQNEYFRTKLFAIRAEENKPVYWDQDKIVLKMAKDLAKEIFGYKDTTEIKNSPVDPKFWCQNRFLINPSYEKSKFIVVGYYLGCLQADYDMVNGDK